MNINIITARDLNSGIGKDNSLPWRMPSDLKFFKNKTMNGVIVLGRKTFDSLPGILPGRAHWVISKSRMDVIHPEVSVFKSPEMILQKAKEMGLKEIWIAGGATIYKEFLPYADTLYINEIQTSTDSDTFFPPPNEYGFKLLTRELGEKTEKDQHEYYKETWIKS